MAIESPRYTVATKTPVFEIRQYEPYIIAQVEIESDFDNAVNLGFQPLARYIFGNNPAKSHIPMTVTGSEAMTNVPQKIVMTRQVVASASGQGRYTVSFTRPAKCTLKTIPEPNDRSIRIKAVPAHKAAVIRFRGLMNARLFQRKEKELRAALEQQSLKFESGASAAQYDPPWIPGFFRRHEIIIEIE
jgi:hypothetical protein